MLGAVVSEHIGTIELFHWHGDKEQQHLYSPTRMCYTLCLHGGCGEGEQQSLPTAVVNSSTNRYLFHFFFVEHINLQGQTIYLRDRMLWS